MITFLHDYRCVYTHTLPCHTQTQTHTVFKCNIKSNPLNIIHRLMKVNLTITSHFYQTSAAAAVLGHWKQRTPSES